MLRRRVVNSTAVVLLFALLSFSFFVSIPWWSYTVVILAWFLITLCGSFFIGWNYHLQSLHRNKVSKSNWVSITFDDGPHPEFTPQVLQLLKAYKVKATFFCIGQQIEKHPDILKQILSDGHSVGNHTYSHSKSFGFFSFQKVMEELQKTKSIVNTIAGLKMNLYRPAFGVTNPQIEKVVENLGLRSLGWSVRSLDTTPRSENRVFARIINRVSKGDIILLHDTSEKSIAVLERLLVFLQEKNLRSVSVERLLDIKAYE